MYIYVDSASAYRDSTLGVLRQRLVSVLLHACSSKCAVVSSACVVMPTSRSPPIHPHSNSFRLYVCTLRSHFSLHLNLHVPLSAYLHLSLHAPFECLSIVTLPLHIVLLIIAKMLGCRMREPSTQAQPYVLSLMLFLLPPPPSPNSHQVLAFPAGVERQVVESVVFPSTQRVLGMLNVLAVETEYS